MHTSRVLARKCCWRGGHAARGDLRRPQTRPPLPRGGGGLASSAVNIDAAFLDGTYSTRQPRVSGQACNDLAAPCPATVRVACREAATTGQDTTGISHRHGRSAGGNRHGKLRGARGHVPRAQPRHPPANVASRAQPGHPPAGGSAERKLLRVGRAVRPLPIIREGRRADPRIQDPNACTSKVDIPNVNFRIFLTTSILVKSPGK